MVIVNTTSNASTIKDIENGIKVNFKHSGVKFQSCMAKLWKDKLLCDVVIKAGSVEIEAHKNVLATQSDYFHAMFTTNMVESKQRKPCVNLGEFDTRAVSAVVDYMYTGCFTVTKCTVQDLLILTDLLQMLELKEVCVTFMSSQLDISNFLGVLEMAEKYNCRELFTKAETLLKQEFQIISSKTEDFLAISLERLRSILQYNDLVLGSLGEGTVLFKSNILIQENTEVQSIIDNQLYSSEPVHDRNADGYILVAGGYLQSRIGSHCPRLNTVEIYDIKTDTWRLMTSLPHVSSGVHLFNLNGKIVCIALENIDSPAMQQVHDSKGVYEYNKVTEKWKDITSAFPKSVILLFQDCFCSKGCLALDPEKYIMYLIMSERQYFVKLDIDVDGDVKCSNAFPLPCVDSEEPCPLYKLSNFAHVILNGRIYIIGGYETLYGLEKMAISDVYVYSIADQTWHIGANMNIPRASFEAVVLEGYIYAVGGCNSCRLNSVERYDPVADTWTTVASMNKERCHHKAVGVNGKLYALGGQSYSTQLGGARKVLNMMEVYEPKYNTWTCIKEMSQRRCLFGGTAL
ncbi:hypothetical protein ACJMK2_016218 [Sinanodonta woodiana]|uniref:BTB domain-containing protein n=1 Tax=Sinanodonta woodiana TaxID=1069815 RepID=A0ABD3USY1_SINWO